MKRHTPATTDHPWADATRTPDNRGELILAAMELADKIALLHGVSPPSTSIGPFGDHVDGHIAGNEKLGIPDVYQVGAGAGVTAGYSTELPAPICLAATFDPGMSRLFGEVIGRETRARGCQVSLGGDVNVARMPLNGRTFEAYGEDPLVASEMIVTQLAAIQQQGVLACVKHFALNNQETNRGHKRENYRPTEPGIDVRVDDRTMREIYLPAFEAAVKRADVATVMCSYNRITGDYASANHRLLTQILKNEWGFRGWVVSDWWATHDTLGPVLAGLDQEMPLGDHYGDALVEAVTSGRIPEKAIDDIARRILTTMFEHGLFDEPATATSNRSFDHSSVAKEVAASGAVLLVNDGVLPLNTSRLRNIAVIGADAASAVTAGGGSAHVVSADADTVLDEIRAKFAAASLEFSPGTDPVSPGVCLPGMEPVPSAVFKTSPAAEAVRGVTARYYSSRGFGGDQLATRVEPYVCTDWNWYSYRVNGAASSLPSAPEGTLSVIWEGTFVAPAAGEYSFDLTSIDDARAFLDGELWLDNSGGHDVRTVRTEIQLSEGQSHEIRVEYRPEARFGRIKLGWCPPSEVVEPSIQRAADVARRADVALVVVRDYQTEGADRPDLGLPCGQDRMIATVAAANPNTVVVAQCGGPIVMPWIEDVRAVLLTWYGGERGGAALAELLAGDRNPSGRLPITFPRQLTDVPCTTPLQYPGVDRAQVYSERLGVGYRHYDMHHIEPLFAFGHGLSYTEFEYDDLVVAARGASGALTIDVTVGVRNVGSRRGTEVVQCYVGSPAEADEPPQRLAAFSRIVLDPGERCDVKLTVAARRVAIWDTGEGAWRVVAGRYELRVGASSRDIRLTATVEVQA